MGRASLSLQSASYWCAGFARSWRPCHMPSKAPRRLNSTSAPNATGIYTRMHKLNSRLPVFLQNYTRPLLNAPATHVGAFLVLHEITAVVPIIGMVAVFEYTGWLPAAFSQGEWFSQGTKKMGSWFRKRGWIDDGQSLPKEKKHGKIVTYLRDRTRSGRRVSEWWNHGERASRLVVELGTAYAIVKVLIIPRLIFSVWATPLFARAFIIAPSRVIKRWARAPKPAQASSPAAGTNATAGGVASPR